MKKQMNWEKIYLTGYEIYAMAKAKNSKLKITYEDGNFIQRDYTEWADERSQRYLDSVVKNFHHNPIYIIEWGSYWYVVDGQHRTKYIIEHIDNNFGQNEKDIFSRNLFEVILIKFSGTQDEFIDYASEIFLTLNDTSDSVSPGALFKALINKSNKKIMDEILKLFEEHYKKVKYIKDKKYDEIFQLVGYSVFLLKKKSSLNSIKTLKDEAIAEFDSHNFKGELSTMLDFIKFLHKNKIYANVTNSNKSKHNDHTFYAMFLSFDEKLSANIINSKTEFQNLTKLPSWRDSKKNTRTPDAIKFKFEIMKAMVDGVVMEEVVNNVLK